MEDAVPGIARRSEHTTNKQANLVVRATSQPGLFVVETEKGYLMADAHLGQSFPWPKDAGRPAEWGYSAVLSDRRHALVVTDNQPRELLLVDWQRNCSTVLWKEPSAAFRVNSRIHVAPDERHVALWGEIRQPLFVEWRRGWLIVPLDPREEEPRWIGVPGITLGMLAHPAFGMQGYWLDSRHFLLQRTPLDLRATGGIEGSDLFVVRVN